MEVSPVELEEAVAMDEDDLSEEEDEDEDDDHDDVSNCCLLCDHIVGVHLGLGVD